ncbi:CAF17-like 4Fe-4S cluster assembly/insertion protein YgfZ [Silvibacterium acidisoli]|uniref:CAF17-like 4Fe-4S cluster assembly/insertion protein YgfZ n=1 Tax=Acidobacteriaceae bacterium ZG23-2 TaxID=2883246 RepID=UPI00406D4E65
MSLTAENTSVTEVPLEATPLAGLFPAGDSVAYRGALTPRGFSSVQNEVQALTASAGLYDLGYLSALKITGSDRVRWLNGMVTNTVRSLEAGQHNYSFLLNAQGRILGDCTVFNFDDSLLLESDRTQIASIAAHLDRFIIMDDVELQPLDATSTTIGLSGPSAAEILAKAGLPLPAAGAFAQASFLDAPIVVANASESQITSLRITLPVTSLEAAWKTLENAGAVPCGVEAVEALRILEGTPLFGIDILSTHLPQETAQTRALNFDKGCYLGQEIVERIRSRATIHRTFRQFRLSGALHIETGQPVPVTAEASQRNPVGELTSAASFSTPSFSGHLALGFVRTEVLERKLAMACGDIAVEALDKPPLP